MLKENEKEALMKLLDDMTQYDIKSQGLDFDERVTIQSLYSKLRREHDGH